MDGVKANLETVAREPVIPEKWSKKENPVTRKDLGKDFRALVQWDTVAPADIELCFDQLKLGDVIKLWIVQKGVQDGTVLSLERNKKCDRELKKNLTDLIRRKIYLLSVAGFVPYTGQRPVKKRYNYPEPLISPSFHQWLVKNGGRLFGGWEVGEQCGRYLDTYARKYRRRRKGESYYDYYCRQDMAGNKAHGKHSKHMVKNYFRNRKEAYRDFRQWLNIFEQGLHNYLTPVVHTNYAHYLCEMKGTRLLGAELALILINHQVAFAYLRGAARQYGLLFWALPSMFNRWGVSLPAEPGQTHTGTCEIGPAKGTSPDLARRIWYLGYLYGASMLGIECGHFSWRKEGDRKLPVLTEMGKVQVEGKEWCEKHPDRGVQYNPVALMLDFHNGWLAPKHGYQSTGERRLVWGALPYEKSDHQIDNFFRWVFPGYEEASYHRDEKGFFVPTSYGDIFDVLLSNADPLVFKRYNVIVLLGDCRVAGELKTRLRNYVADGGDLVVSANNIPAPDEEFCGIKTTQRKKHASLSRTAERTYPEDPYTYRLIKNIRAQVLLESTDKDPLVTVNRFGKGRVFVITADCGMSDLKIPRDKKTGLASQKIKHRNPGRILTNENRTEFFEHRNWDCPYNCGIKNMLMKGTTLGAIEKEVCVHCRVECTNDVSKQCDILTGVKKVLGGYFESFMPFTIEGPPVHYLVNLTKNRKKIIVTLANHSQSRWEGNIRFKNPGMKIRSVREWMKDEPSGLRRIKIPPKDLKILEITADQPIL